MMLFFVRPSVRMDGWMDTSTIPNINTTMIQYIRVAVFLFSSSTIFPLISIPDFPPPPFLLFLANCRWQHEVEAPDWLTMSNECTRMCMCEEWEARGGRNGWFMQEVEEGQVLHPIVPFLHACGCTCLWCNAEIYCGIIRQWHRVIRTQ